MLTLVTGAAGHLGNNVVRALLARGRKVRALVHSEAASLEGLDVEKRHGDVVDRSSLDNAFEGVDVVYHFAAKVSIDPAESHQVMRINIEGPRNVVDACLAHGVRRLVHCSSIHALTPGGSNGVTDERCAPNTDPTAPAYDRSKAAGEMEVRVGIAKKLDAVIVNPAGVMGPHDYVPHLAGRALIEMYLGRLPMNVASGFNWVDARDVAGGAIAAETRGRSGEQYLLSGHWAPMTDVAAIMRSVTGRRGPRLVAPLWLAKMGLPFIGAYARLTGAPPLYTGPSLRALSEHRRCDNGKARRELGFAPRPLEQTVADTLGFYESAGLLVPGVTRGTSLPVGDFV